MGRVQVRAAPPAGVGGGGGAGEGGVGGVGVCVEGGGRIGDAQEGGVESRSGGHRRRSQSETQQTNTHVLLGAHSEKKLEH